MREYYGTTCTSPRFFFFFPLLYACLGPVIPGHSFVPPQILDRTPRAAPCAYPARPARHPPAGRALRPGADIRRDLDLGSWHHGDIPGRLFRDPDGSPRRGIPLQRASRSHVRWQYDVLRRDGFMVRAGCYSRVLAREETDGMRLTFHFCRYERPVGLLITLYVHIVYTIALKFEG